jgi:hypothetical protein
MKFITLFAGALAATTAANILLASDAYGAVPTGFDPPNGWQQVGKYCNCASHFCGSGTGPGDYYKLQKKSKTAVYGVWNNSTSQWVGSKNLTLIDANTKMNKKCGIVYTSVWYYNPSN